jgi:hypothetical protein
MTSKLNDYKFLVIAYISGCKGHYLGLTLSSLFPENCGMYKILPQFLKSKLGKNRYYHNAIPYFFEILHSPLENKTITEQELIQHDSYSALDKNKFNVVMTHTYSDTDLIKLKQVLGKNTKIIKIVFEENDVDKFVDRFIDIYEGLSIPNKQVIDYVEFRKYARNNVYQGDSEFLTLQYNMLEDKEYIFNKISETLDPNHESKVV